MNGEVLERPHTPSSAAIVSHSSGILSSILQPAVQLALWQRPRPFALNWIDTLNWDEIDDIDARIAGPDWAAAISELLRGAGYPIATTTNALTQELAERAGQFAALMRCDQLTMRLEVIETDACRKFHMDYVPARLLMPLHGLGTQWIDTNHGSDVAINQLGLGDVAIFKGRQCVQQPAILHRSPPIMASGETRLLFVLNPPSTPSPFAGRLA